MLSKIEKFRDEHPKVRRILDEISDFCDKALIVNYIITFIISTVVICVPTIMAFLLSLFAQIKKTFRTK